ncbi:MAG: cell division protein FtsQ/DivIB [Gallionella sp.]|nr:cell division protein FtsQ/DivIB [Gallionella sp.]
MWDNPILLRNVANVLIFFSVLGLLYGAVYYLVHLPGLFPVRSVRLSAAPQRVSTEELMRVLRSEVRGNLFVLDIERLRQSLEKLPWARNVSIRREFPQGLAVQFEEHQALARWNDNALVNQLGEVFVAESEQVLPGFIGQDGSSAEIAQRYAQYNQQLAPLNLSVAQVALSPRHAWRLRLSNGTVLELGREDMQQRLARFVAVQKAGGISIGLAAASGQHGRMDGNSIRRQKTEDEIKYVDLRYRNGFAVRQGGRG